MKKTDCLIDALVLLVCQLFSCAVIYLAASLIVTVVSRFTVLDYFSGSVLYAVILFAGVGALMGVYAYRDSYRTADRGKGGTILSCAIALMVHLLIAAVFRYLPLLSGAALYLSGILSMGTGFHSVESMADIPGVLPPVLFVLIWVFYDLLMLLLRVLGANRRKTDRYELTGSPEMPVPEEKNNTSGQ